MIDERDIEADFDRRVSSDPTFAAKAAQLGLQRAPYDYQRCDNCIYYLGHRQFCDHPDLRVAVGAAWWCNLWRN